MRHCSFFRGILSAACWIWHDCTHLDCPDQSCLTEQINSSASDIKMLSSIVSGNSLPFMNSFTANLIQWGTQACWTLTLGQHFFGHLCNFCWNYTLTDRWKCRSSYLCQQKAGMFQLLGRLHTYAVLWRWLVLYYGTSCPQPAFSYSTPSLGSRASSHQHRYWPASEHSLHDAGWNTASREILVS